MKLSLSSCFFALLSLTLSTAHGLDKEQGQSDVDAAAADRAERRSQMHSDVRRRAQDNADAGADCFSGDATATLLGGKAIKMKDLKLGDSVMAANGSYSKVISFHHLDDSKVTSFLQLKHLNGILEVTPKHFVHVMNGGLLQAQHIKVGSTLIGSNGQAVVVQAIDKVIKTGVYAPHTYSGDLLVDGVLASSFSSLFTGVPGTVQAAAFHLMYMPHYTYCSVSSSCESETYYGEGGYNWLVYHLGLPLSRAYHLALSASTTTSWTIIPALVTFAAMSQKTIKKSA